MLWSTKYGFLCGGAEDLMKKGLRPKLHENLHLTTKAGQKT